MNKELAPIHPGEMLREESLVPMHLSTTRFAERTGIAIWGLEAILAGRGRITDDIDCGLSATFGLPIGYRLRLQGRYDRVIANDSAGEG